MNQADFERLLYEEESATLDFKEQQYRFTKGTDVGKSELLKDILGFANSWRRIEAYILIGVKDVRGGQGEVVGIPAMEHLDDHSLQQFVNNKTNRPVQFHYEAFSYKEKQVGILRIEVQERPIFLKTNFGRLKKSEVYVRRGSSTDPHKPADPDEISLMGNANYRDRGAASLIVEFACPDEDRILGDRFNLETERCLLPKSNEIPTAEEPSSFIELGGGFSFPMPSLDPYNRHNDDYFRELANYLFHKKLFRKVRFAVTNTGDSPASNLQVEIRISFDHGIRILDAADFPEAPKRTNSLLTGAAFDAIHPIYRHAGAVTVETSEAWTKIDVVCGMLQPGRRLWTDTFFIGAMRSGEFEISGEVFAAELAKPKQITLAICASVHETRMTIDELLTQDEPQDEEG